MALAVLLHLADRAYGFGYILSAIALIVFGMSAASAFGYSIADQEPYVAVIGPLVLIPPLVRAVYSARVKPPTPSPVAGPAKDHRDRNARHALSWLTTSASYLNEFTFHFVSFCMVAIAAYFVFADQRPPAEAGTGLLVGGGFLGTHIAGKFTESILWRTVALGLGIMIGGLLYALALYARLYREGHIQFPV